MPANIFIEIKTLDLRDGTNVSNALVKSEILNSAGEIKYFEIKYTDQDGSATFHEYSRIGSRTGSYTLRCEVFHVRYNTRTIEQKFDVDENKITLKNL